MFIPLPSLNNHLNHAEAEPTLLPTESPHPDKVFTTPSSTPRDKDIATRITPADSNYGPKWVTVDSQAKLVHPAGNGE